MTNIIIVGYPKSGSTWVTRLVAELVKCPVVGFWNQTTKPHRVEIAREGLHRKSNFQCFKSHHQLHELHNTNISCEDKIIYVLRDPRDIVISGAYYFRIERWPSISKLIAKLPRGWYFRKKLAFSAWKTYRVDQMIHTVLYGSREIHRWLCVPWKTHYRPYLEHNCFFVKYEDLLSSPEYECKRILRYLGVHKQDDQIREAIEEQSFEKKKRSFLKNNELRKTNFMRIGKSEQWRQMLSKKQKRLFVEILTNELMQYGYPTDDNI